MTEDFSGWATRHNIQCSDGKTILPGAFAQNDKKVVPLVYAHGHKDQENILGKCVLEHTDQGVYARAYFNETARGQHAKELVKHGDLRYLSIFANQLKQQDGYVSHGNIREVSLVVAGANPGAYIDNVSIAHSDGFSDDVETDEAVITSGEDIVLRHDDEGFEEYMEHADNEEETLEDILDTLNEKQETAVYYLLGQALSGESTTAKHSAFEDEGDDIQHSDFQEDNNMAHNIFDRSSSVRGGQGDTLSHDAMSAIVDLAVESGSLKRAVKTYALQHGIDNIDLMFPDAKAIETNPAFISRRMEWVTEVLSNVRKVPFAKLKTLLADITPDEARAKGYIKGEKKEEEFFAMIKRETNPQTIYKKQKLDRDDVIDITDIDVVAFMKAEMRVMLDEEVAGAILVGDGRSIASKDKIKETNIRPIAKDDDLYNTTVWVNLDDADSTIEELTDEVIAARKHYKGSGQPVFYTTENVIAKFLTVKDSFGRRIYQNLTDVAAVLRVSRIVPVEVMERDSALIGVMVNLNDYTVGANSGGQVTMFDDFDIDYNAQKYLIETRMSGALTVPKSAVTFRKTASTAKKATPSKPEYDADLNAITVPTIQGVVYKDEAGQVLTTADPVEVTPETSPFMVVATPASGYYFSSSDETEWTFEFQA